jgi:hypothetical protein
MFNIVHININLLLSDPRLIKIYNSESSLMTLFEDSLFLKKMLLIEKELILLLVL